MKLHKDPMWNLISNIAIRLILLMFGIFLATQPDTICFILGILVISTQIFSTTNFISTLIKNQKNQENGKSN
jgi:hypothetical protein